MKTLLFVLGLALPTFAFAADKPVVPENIKFADVCKYDTWSTALTCQDAGGNVLIDRVDVYKGIHLFDVDKLDMFALMKRNGFDVKSTMKIGYTFEVIFYRRP